MITRVLNPADVPETTSDWERMNGVLTALALARPSAIAISGSNIAKGSVIRYGGSWYLADEDTAITGSSSPYVQFTVSLDGDTLSAAYVADLTGVSFNRTYNTWSDVQGRVYYFDEAYAYAWGEILSQPTLEAWRPANANLAKLLTSGLGNGKWRSLAETAYISEYFASGAPSVKRVTGVEDKPELNKFSTKRTTVERATPSSDETEIFVVTMSSLYPVTIVGFDLLYEHDDPSASNWINVYRVGGGLVGTATDASTATIVCDGNDETLSTTPIQYSVAYREYGSGETRGPWRCRVRCRVAPATILEGEITPMELSCSGAVTISIATSAG